MISRNPIYYHSPRIKLAVVRDRDYVLCAGVNKSGNLDFLECHHHHYDVKELSNTERTKIVRAIQTLYDKR